MSAKWTSAMRRERGFTLVEMLVTLFALAIILILSAELLFSTRRGAARQQLQVEARQIARGALDYVTYLARGASDLNTNANPANPLAILTYSASGVQATYDNVTDATLADAGTDIITFAWSENPDQAFIDPWPGSGSSANYWGFRMECPPTGDDGGASFARLQADAPTPVGGVSGPILVVDLAGHYAFYEITDFMPSDNSGVCAAGCNTGFGPSWITGCVKLTGQASTFSPPGADATVLSGQTAMNLGVRFISLRVRDGWLEQKSGYFDPNTDNPGTAFTRMMPNVEDMQIAYYFLNGQVWNNAPGHSLSTADSTHCVQNVPAAPGLGSAFDVRNVVGVRISIGVRSSSSVPGETSPRFSRPAIEDHPAATTPDTFYHYQLSAVAMLRNRIRQS